MKTYDSRLLRQIKSREPQAEKKKPSLGGSASWQMDAFEGGTNPRLFRAPCFNLERHMKEVKNAIAR